MYKYIILSFIITFLSSSSYAVVERNHEGDNDILGAPSDEYLSKEDQDKKTEYQKIISDYKNYLAGVKPKVMEEIREYRKEVVKINKQKKELFRSLSQEAQRYLAKEEDVKRKLPINKLNLSM